MLVFRNSSTPLRRVSIKLINSFQEVRTSQNSDMNTFCTCDALTQSFVIHLMKSTPDHW